jgi:hypothetical protein
MEEIKHHIGDRKLSLRFILCDITGQMKELASEGMLVASPIRCLNSAVDRAPEYIIIHFGRMSIQEREGLVELGTLLKRNRYTHNYPVVALLVGKHRHLLESLSRVGVDFVRYVGPLASDWMQAGELLDALGSDDRMENQLEAVCPFLHYSEIDSCHELTMCGGYLDRMILGGRCLHEICETRNHLHCEYYLKPRVKV